MQRAVDGLAALRNENLEITAVRAERDVAAHAASAGRGHARSHLVDDRGDDVSGISDVAENAVGEVPEHLFEPDALGEMQRKGEVGGRHRAKFYSERRPKSTRARSQSAAICALRLSSESKARSSRIRCTNPTRIDVPYRSPSKPKMCVSVTARPD